MLQGKLEGASPQQILIELLNIVEDAVVRRIDFRVHADRKYAVHFFLETATRTRAHLMKFLS